MHGLAFRLGSPLHTAAHGREQFANADALDLQLQAATVRAGDEEEILCQLRESVDVLRPAAHRFPQLVDGVCLPERHLELGAQERQRRPQFVTGVGDEVPLALKRALEPVEHLVQRATQPLELVTRRRNREPLPGRVRGDRRRSPPHRLDLPQRHPGEKVAGAGGEDQRDRSGEQ